MSRTWTRWPGGSPPEDLRRTIAAVDRAHNVDTGFFVRKAIARRCLPRPCVG